MNGEKDYVFKILVSLIPVAIVGFTLNDLVEKIFSTDYVAAHTGNGLLLVGCMLIVAALLLDCSERMTARNEKNNASKTDVAKTDVAKTDLATIDVVKTNVAKQESSGVDYCDNSAINSWPAFVVGIAQAIAVLPGLSRSGSTISTGLLCKVKKSSVAQFSFLMVIIPILGQAFLDVYKALKNTGDIVASTGAAADAGTAVAGSSASIGFLLLLLGFLAAFFAGWAACKWMVKLVKNVKLTGFAIYCAIVGILCVVLPYLIK